eukprot:17012-Heterococcus_DN1.PRE.1
MGRGGKLKCLLMHFDFEVNPISLKKWLMQVVTSATARSSVCDCLQLIKYAHKSWTDKDNVNEWGKTQDFFVTKHNVVSCSHYTFNDATPRAMTQSGVVHDIETIDRFYDAISCCNIAAVSGLAQEVPQLLKTRAGRFSCGPMAVAAKVVAPVVAQKLQLLQTLLHCGADVNERSSSSNTTALNHLAHRGDVECVQFLLHEGADACMGSNATPPWLPVHTAIKRNYLQVVELLVQWHCATDRIDGMRSVIRPESDHWKSEHIEALAAVVARYATAAGATGVAASTGSNKRVRSQLINNSSATGAAASAAAAAASVTASAETAAATTAASTLAATGGAAAAAVIIAVSAHTAQGDAATGGTGNVNEQMEIDVFRSVNNSSASGVGMNSDALLDIDDIDANLDNSNFFKMVFKVNFGSLRAVAVIVQDSCTVLNWI